MGYRKLSLANHIVINYVQVFNIFSIKIIADLFATYTKSSTFAITKHRGVEQLVARWAHNPKVVCSSQASATKEKSAVNFTALFSFICHFTILTTLATYIYSFGREYKYHTRSCIQIISPIRFIHFINCVTRIILIHII